MASRLRSRALRSTVSVAVLAALSVGLVVASAQAVSQPNSPTFANVTSTPSTVTTTVASPCATDATLTACNAPVTMSYGNGPAVRLTSFTAGADNSVFTLARAADGSGRTQSADILRVDNANITGKRDLIWMSRNAGANTATVIGSDPVGKSMADVLGDSTITDGADNVFANGTAGSTVVNLNNIERVSFMSPTPITPAEPSRGGVLLMERGGNDPAHVAAVLTTDSSGHPLTFGPTVVINVADWKKVATGLASTVLRKTATDTQYRPSTAVGAQDIGGVFISYSDLGIAVGQQVAGVAVVANDQNDFTGNWVLTTSDASGAGGLDLMGGLLASDIGPGSVSGRLYKDKDVSGTDTAGDPGIAGVTVELRTAQGTLLQSTTSASDGSYSFTNLPGMKYSVQVKASTLPSDVPSLPTAESDGVTDGVSSASVLFAAPDVTGVTLGYAQPRVVSGSVVDTAGAPISGVTVGLYSTSGTLLQSVTTGSDGAYAFGPVVAGSYQVRETQPTNYATDSQRPGTGSTDDGANKIGVTTTAAAGSAGNDFVESAPAGVISGSVATVGGTTIAGVTITLLDSSGTTVGAATSAPNGTWSFTGLTAGNYVVVETQPTAYATDSDVAGSNATVAATNKLAATLGASGAASTSTGNQFLEKSPVGVISGSVATVGSAPIQGVTVSLLDSTGTTVATTTSAANGTWSFTGLPGGSFRVRETQPADYLTDSDVAGSNATVSSANNLAVTLAASGATASSTGNAFVEKNPAGVVSGTVRATAGDPIGGVTVTLDDSNGATVGTTTSASNGSWTFSALKPGSYTATETQPSAYATDSDVAGTNANVTGTNTVAATLGLTGTSSTSTGSAFVEKSPSGVVSGTVLTAGGTPIAGVTITLSDSNGAPVATATSAANGSWSFGNLKPGSYTVTETQPAAYVTDSDQPGTNATSPSTNTFGITLQNPGSTSTGSSFVEKSPAGVVSGTVVTTEGTSIAGVTVTVTDSNGATVGTTTSAANGTWSFADLLPGGYTVKETQPSAYETDSDVAGSNATVAAANTLAVTLGTTGAAKTSTGNSFVEKASAGLVTGTVRTAAGTSIAGVTVTLRDSANAVMATTTSAVNGTWTFASLGAGSFTATETQPAAYATDSDIAGSNATVSATNTLAITLAASGVGSSSTGNAFVETNPAGKISGTVKTTSDAAIAGVTVNLTASDGTILGTTTSAADGSWFFTGLQPASYTVTETQPAAYLTDSDVAGANATVAATNTLAVTLSTPTDTSTGNRFVEKNPGASISGFVTTTAGSAIGGVTVTLRSSNGATVATTTSAANGSWGFSGLVGGTFTVTETQPAAYLTDSDVAGTSATVAGANKLAVALAAGSDSTGNGFVEKAPTGSIAGGVHTASGTPIAGVTVTIVDSIGASVGTVTTVADGSWSFTGLLPGTYTVTETQPVAYASDSTVPGTSATSPSDNRIDVTLALGSAPSTGNAFIETNPSGLISGIVRSIPTDPIAGVTVTLLDSNGTTIATTTSAANGSWSFPGLPAGDYTVVETQPTGYATSSDIAGSNASVPADNTIAVTLGTSGSALTSTGNQFVEKTPSGVVSGIVRTQAGVPIPGVTVELLDNHGAVVASSVSGSTGAWSFTGLLSGSYSVRETQPAGYLTDSDVAGSNATVSASNLLAVVLDETVVTTGSSLGNVFLEKNPTSAISGSVLDKDGKPIAGVEVRLLDASGAVVRMATTGSNGEFSFTGLPAGSYVVHERQPKTYESDSQTPGDGGATVAVNVINITLPVNHVSAGTVFVEKQAKTTTTSDPRTGLLAFTGSSPGLLLGTAVFLMLLAGLVFLVGARRRLSRGASRHSA